MSVLHYSFLLREAYDNSLTPVWQKAWKTCFILYRICAEKKDNVYTTPLCLFSSLCVVCDYTLNVKPRCSCRSWTIEDSPEPCDNRARHFSVDRNVLIPHTHTHTSFPPSLSLSLSSHHHWSVKSVRVSEATLKISSRIQSTHEYKMHSPLAMWWWGKDILREPVWSDNLCICKLNLKFK